MSRTRVKFCGITRAEDAIAAAVVGADAIGLVFTQRSKRYVSAAQAAEVVAALPPLITRVALFMNAGAREVEQILKQVNVDLLQFHGQESPAFCAAFGKPYMKALGLGGLSDQSALALTCEAWREATALLLDAHQPGEPGGQGQVFDWTIIPRALPVPMVLAGGLTPHNVAAAVRQVRPYAVDVSSGVEVRPGIKDQVLMQQFVEEVRRGDIG